MAHLRYVRNPAHVPARRPGLDCTVRSLRVRYETDPEIHAALLPRPCGRRSGPRFSSSTPTSRCTCVPVTTSTSARPPWA